MATPAGIVASGLAPVDYGIVAAYMLGMVGLGALFSRGQKSTESYFLGIFLLAIFVPRASTLGATLGAAAGILAGLVVAFGHQWGCDTPNSASSFPLPPPPC